MPEDLGRALDLRRVGVYGHSAGGTTAAQAMYEDRRVGAAVNLDHPPETPGWEGGTVPGRPGRRGSTAAPGGKRRFSGERLDRSRSAVLARSGGCARRWQLDDAMHWVFTDCATMAPQLQAAGLMTAEVRVALVGAIDPAESVSAVRDHVLTFFDRHVSRAPGSRVVSGGS